MRMKDALEAAYQDLLVQVDSQYLNIPALMGGVGIGKTEGALSLCIRLAEEMGDQILLETIATGEAGDPTDTIGVPWIIPVEGDATKEEYKVLWALNRAAYQACKVPTMLLFDDIDKANPIIVNALLNLFVHRRFKDYKLHPMSVMMCCGNRSSDDKSAHELSESILTRLTVIEVEPNLEDFTTWARSAPDEDKPYVHPTLLAWLPTKPTLLHKPEQGVYRFPTPRGYREASLHMYKFPEEKNWKALLDRKLGSPATTDFWMWFTILRGIDVDYILANGHVKEPYKVTDPKVPMEVVQKIGEFASMFAVVERLSRGVSPGHAGLEKFVDSLSSEMRVAFLLQFTEKTKAAFTKHYGKLAGRIMGTIVKGGV